MGPEFLKFRAAGSMIGRVLGRDKRNDQRVGKDGFSSWPALGFTLQQARGLFLMPGWKRNSHDRLEAYPTWH